MTLTIKLDGNWSSFQLANSAPPLSVTDSAIAPSARMVKPVDATVLKSWTVCVVNFLGQEKPVAGYTAVDWQGTQLWMAGTNLAVGTNLGRNSKHA